MPLLYLALLLSLPAAEPALPPPTFTVARADGSTVTGPLHDISATWSVTLGGKTPAQIEGTEVLSLRRTDKSLPPFPPEAQVLFANGDRLAGRVGEILRER